MAGGCASDGGGGGGSGGRLFVAAMVALKKRERNRVDGKEENANRLLSCSDGYDHGTVVTARFDLTSTSPSNAAKTREKYGLHFFRKMAPRVMGGTCVQISYTHGRSRAFIRSSLWNVCAEHTRKRLRPKNKLRKP